MERIWRLSVVVIVLALAPMQAWAVVTGNEWLTLSEQGRAWYVIGVIDSWNNLKALIAYEVETLAKRERSASEVVFLQAIDCAVTDGARGMTRKQAVALVEKYMKENPRLWHFPMAGSV